MDLRLIIKTDPEKHQADHAKNVEFLTRLTHHQKPVTAASSLHGHDSLGGHHVLTHRVAASSAMFGFHWYPEFTKFNECTALIAENARAIALWSIDLLVIK
jgi:hypothetical protein